MKQEEIVEKLIDYLQNGNAKQRREAAYTLSDYKILRKKAKKTLPILNQVRNNDEDHRVRFYANKAYKRIKGYENYSNEDNIKSLVSKALFFLTFVFFILAILLNIILHSKFPNIYIASIILATIGFLCFIAAVAYTPKKMKIESLIKKILKRVLNKLNNIILGKSKGRSLILLAFRKKN